MDGIFAVYKPKGVTSFEVIQEIKKLTGEKKVGHAGTLDPLAKGVLVVGVGREATKKLKEFVLGDKEYIGSIRLGAVSPTDDAEGPLEIKPVLKRPSKTQITKILNKFVGKIKQTPPAYSAVKIKGERAYRLARAGKSVKLRPRSVTIKHIEMVGYRWPYLCIRVVTGPGVYIRALARDIGKELKTGAYLADLERVRVGNFTKENALTIDRLRPA